MPLFSTNPLPNITPPLGRGGGVGGFNVRGRGINHKEAQVDRTLTKVKNLGLAEELGGSSIGWPLKALDKVRDWTAAL